MQTSQLNCTTIEVVNNQDTSGRAPADESDRGFRTGKEKKVWHIDCSTFLGSLMVVGLFIALAPIPARADDDRGGRRGNDKDRAADLPALRAQVESLQTTVSALESQVST